jgi:hypothetical protein
VKKFLTFFVFLKTCLAEADALLLKSLCRLLQLQPICFAVDTALIGFNCSANQRVFFSEERDYSTAFLRRASLFLKIFSGH